MIPSLLHGQMSIKNEMGWGRGRNSKWMCLQNIVHCYSLSLCFLDQRVYIETCKYLVFSDPRRHIKMRKLRTSNLLIGHRWSKDQYDQIMCRYMNIRITMACVKSCSASQMAGTLSRRTVNMSNSKPSHFWYSLEI